VIGETISPYRIVGEALRRHWWSHMKGVPALSTLRNLEEAPCGEKRALKVVLVLVGLLFLAGVYPLWRLQLDPSEQMLGSAYAALGVFLLPSSITNDSQRISAYFLRLFNVSGRTISIVGDLPRLLSRSGNRESQVGLERTDSDQSARLGFGSG
jgi:hypothetical protein